MLKGCPIFPALKGRAKFKPPLRGEGPRPLGRIAEHMRTAPSLGQRLTGRLQRMLLVWLPSVARDRGFRLWPSTYRQADRAALCIWPRSNEVSDRLRFLSG